MRFIGFDCDPGYQLQQMAVLALATREMVDKALSHKRKRRCGPFRRGWKGSYEWTSKPLVAAVRADAGGVGIRSRVVLKGSTCGFSHPRENVVVRLRAREAAGASSNGLECAYVVRRMLCGVRERSRYGRRNLLPRSQAERSRSLPQSRAQSYCATT